MFANRRNSRVLQEIGVEERDDDVSFQTEVEMSQFRACTLKKICNITLIYGRIAQLYSLVCCK